MNAPRPLDSFAIATTLTLCVCWGFSQAAAKVALTDIAPATQAALRSGAASVLLIAYAGLARRGALSLKGTLGAGALIGVMASLENIVVLFALQRTTASTAALLYYTAPFFFALGAVAVLPAERLAARQWAGMALAFVGVALALMRESSAGSFAGDALALSAGALWGARTVVIKATRLNEADPVTTLLYQTVIGTFVSAAWARLAGEPAPLHVGWLSVGSLAFQSVVVVALTTPVWYWLLTVYRAGELSAFTFLTPVIGVLAGALWLGEPLSGPLVSALALVATGLFIVNWPGAAFLRRTLSRVAVRPK